MLFVQGAKVQVLGVQVPPFAPATTILLGSILSPQPKLFLGARVSHCTTAPDPLDSLLALDRRASGTVWATMVAESGTGRGIVAKSATRRCWSWTLTQARHATGTAWVL